MPFGIPDPAFYSLLGVLLGGILQWAGSYLNLQQRQDAQDRRLRSQERIRFKVNSLIELFEQLDETNRILTEAVNDSSAITAHDVTSDLEPTVDEYINTMRRTRVYLSDDQYEEMQDAMGQFRIALRYIQWKVNNGSDDPPDHIQLNWREFHDAHETATETLRDEINAPLETPESESSNSGLLDRIR